MTIWLHHGDLPEDIDLGPVVAVDSETMGLKHHRDRLCLVQLSSGDGDAHLVKFADRNFAAPRLAALMGDRKVLKLFHYARFDMAVLYRSLGVMPGPVYCTKIASKLVRTYTDRHGLKELCRELLDVDISKQQQSSDWGAAEISEAQQAYAASDVLHLHALKARLDAMLEREGRRHLAEAAFAFLAARAELDLLAGEDFDLLAHA